MAKLCAKGKAQLKESLKFILAYANMYAAGVCQEQLNLRRKRKKMSLRKWTSEKWLISNRRSDGSYPPCGRSKGEKRRNYPNAFL